MFNVITTGPPKECQNYRGQRITLKSGDVSVVLPSIQEDEQIRWLLEHGKSLEDAYKDANAWHIIPDQAMRDCIELVFKEPYFDPDTGTWKTSAGQFTCYGFKSCLDQYAAGLEFFPESGHADRRMLVAPGVYSPSQTEEACIRKAFVDQVPLDQAYRDCGAGDIIPGTDALEMIRSAYVTAMGENKPFPPLFEILKTSSQLTAIPPPSISPSLSPPPISPPPGEKKKPSKLIYYIIGAIILIMLYQE